MFNGLKEDFLRPLSGFSFDSFFIVLLRLNWVLLDTDKVKFNLYNIDVGIINVDIYIYDISISIYVNMSLMYRYLIDLLI